MLKKILIGLAFLLLSPFVFAANPVLDPVVDRPDAWHFSVSPYLWFSGNNGFFNIFDTRANFSVPPTNWHDVDFGGALNFEASKERWSLLLDPSFVKFTQIQYVDDLRAKASIGMVTVDAGAYYRVLPVTLSLESRICASLELMGAFRMMGFHSVINYDDSTVPNISDSTNIITPVLGFRVKYNPYTYLQTWFNADFGGFKIDRVSSTWSAMTGVNYFLNKRWGISLAYKAIGINYYKKAYTLNTIVQGPMLGLTYFI